MGIKVGERWLKLGKKYMDYSRNLDEYTSFLHGFVHTNSLQTISKTGSARSAVVVSTFKEVFDDPQTAIAVCRNKDKIKGRIYDTRKNQTVDWFCDSIEHFDEVKKAIRLCKEDPSKTEEARKILMDLHKQGKLKGFNQKGIDMLLLDSGCDTTVLDMWMLKEFYGVPTNDLAARRGIQLTKKYPVLRDDLERRVMEKKADRGYGLGAWHVAKWLELSTGGNYRRAENFMKDLFSQTRLSEFL
ncbi:hypothetical protein DRP07_00160 [Archaeoglobales archaeon]|nr:MAG: hypothetical protein DRP07_00160 [Archaeoglobales archaeon]